MRKAGWGRRRQKLEKCRVYRGYQKPLCKILININIFVGYAKRAVQTKNQPVEESTSWRLPALSMMCTHSSTAYSIPGTVYSRIRMYVRKYIRSSRMSTSCCFFIFLTNIGSLFHVPPRSQSSTKSEWFSRRKLSCWLVQPMRRVASEHTGTHRTKRASGKSVQQCWK